MDDREKGSGRSGNIAIGLIIIVIGGWFLLQALGVELPSVGALWPLLLMGGGLVFLFMYATGRDRDPGTLIPGVGGVLLGLFFFLFTLGILPWEAMGTYWPVLIILGGLAFLVAYLFGREDPGLLIPGVGGLLIGFFFLAFTTGTLSWEDMGVLWPLFPLLGGVAFVVAYLVGGRQDKGVLWVGLAAVAIGVLGLAITIGSLSLPWLSNFWPILLIVIGLLLVWRSYRGGEEG